MKRSFENFRGSLSSLGGSGGNMNDLGQRAKKVCPPNAAHHAFYRTKSEGDYEIRFLIPYAPAGAVIGKKGSVITRLRAQYTKVAIRIPDSASPERLVDLWSDSKHDLLAMFSDVLEILQIEFQGSGARNRDDVQVRLLCTQNQIASIMMANEGPGLHTLRQAAGVFVRVYPKLAPKSSDRIVSITGIRLNVIHAVDLILTLTDNAQQNGSFGISNEPYNPSNWDSEIVAEYGGYMPGDIGNIENSSTPPFLTHLQGPLPLFPPPPRQDTFTPRYTGNQRCPPPLFPPVAPRRRHYSEVQTPLAFPTTSMVTIPDSFVSGLIGHRGSNIQRVRQESGAAIKIGNELDCNRERVITISGTPAQISEAERLLQQRVLDIANSPRYARS